MKLVFQFFDLVPQPILFDYLFARRSEPLQALNHDEMVCYQ